MVIVWSWIIGSLLSIVIALSMAEICSTYPSAGSVYTWAGNLASKEYGPFAAYVTGWFNFLGNAAGDAFYGFTFAGIFLLCVTTLINLTIVTPIIASISALQVSTCTQEPVADINGNMSSPCALSNNTQCLIGIAVYVVWSIQNLLRVDYQGHINNFATFFQISSTFAIIFTLLATCSKGGGSDAFGNAINATEPATLDQMLFQFYDGE